MTEYTDNYSDTSRGLWQFKRDKVPNYNADLTIDNSQSFKNKAAPVGKTANAVNDTNSSVKKKKKSSCSIKVSKQLLEITRNATNQLQNSSWIKLLVVESSSVGDSATFKLADAKLHVPIVTLSTEENVNLGK